MKNLKNYLKPYKKECILAPGFKLLEAVFDLLVPLVVARMIDTDILGGSRGTVFLYFGVLLLMAAVGLGCTVLAQYFSANASTGFAGALRQGLFEHIQKFSYSDLDTLGSDTLITRLSDDVNQVQTGLNMGLRLLLRSPFIVMGAMVMAFTIDLRCALVFAVTIPILFAVTFFLMKISIPLFGRVQAGLDRVTTLTRENLTGVRVIRAFCREEQSIEEFEGSNRELTRLNLFVGRISALLNPLTYAFINIAAVILIHQAAIQVNLGVIPQGEVVALYNYMLQIIVELVKLAALIITLNKALACAKRTSAVLAIAPEMDYPETDASEDKGSAAVAFEDVSFTYPRGGAPSLRHISFTAKVGETVGIIGGTGSGKTTLVHLIPRFYDATEGRVVVFGRDVKSVTAKTLCDAVGIVPQKAVLFQGSIRENLRWGNEKATDEELWQALEIAQVKDVVEAKSGGLDFRLEQGGSNLSGGQKQRLTIARALVKRAPILILDDSFSALDQATDGALRKALGALSGVTTFIVSQRIVSVRDADKILVLHNGELVGCGNHEDLMEHCRIYREIYASQFPEDAASRQKGGKR